MIRAGDVSVDRFAMEFAAAESHGVSVLARVLLPEGKVLGLGVIDDCDSRVETAAEVVTRAEIALNYISPERLTLNPDSFASLHEARIRQTLTRLT